MTLVDSVRRAVTREPSLPAALARCAREVTRSLAADGAMLFRVADDRALVLAASHPEAAPAVPLRLAPGFGVIGRVASDGIPVVLVDDCPRNPQHRQLLGLAEGDRVSRLCAPARVAGGECVAVLAVHSRSHREFTVAEVDTVQAVADLIGLRLRLSDADTLVRGYRDQWDNAVATTVAAQEAERRRIAGDLHDGVTQAIASLIFHLSAARSALRDGDIDFVSAQVDAAHELADLAFGETRSAITGLRSPVLDDLGLAAGLASLARGVPNLVVEVHAQDLVLPEHVCTSLFRVAQEAVHNVVKHAEASTAVVRLGRRGRAVVLSVADDGRGFDVGGHMSGRPLLAAAGAPFGLVGMAERVRLIGGELRVVSQPMEGTTIEVTVPEVL